MSRNSYASGSLMNLLVHSAVAGAGLSMGHDIYRKTRNNLVFIVLAAIALAGTAYGIWKKTRCMVPQMRECAWAVVVRKQPTRHANKWISDACHNR